MKAPHQSRVIRHSETPGHPAAPPAPPVAFVRRLRPFSLLDRYLLKEMVSAFTLGLGVFTFVLLMNQMIRLMDLIVNKGIGVGNVLRLVLYILPFSLMVTIPMSVLLAVLATYGRLSSEGEAIALKTSGLSLYRLMVPGLLVGIVTTLATLSITIWVQPSSTRAFTTLLHRLYHTKAILALQEGVFNTDYPGLIVYVDRLEERSSSLAGILIIDRRNPADQRIVIAQEGRMLGDGSESGSRTAIQLSRGNIHLSSAENPGRYRNLKFDAYELQAQAAGRLAETFDRPKQGREMSLAELGAQIARLKNERNKVLPFAIEWNKKLALPIACLILSILGTPLGLRIKRASRGISLALSVGLAVLYYILLAAGESLGLRGRIDPALGIWSPNILLALIAIALVLAEGREGLPTARLRPGNQRTAINRQTPAHVERAER
jgi:lipopolysaccharide export system permease protein